MPRYLSILLAAVTVTSGVAKAEISHCYWNDVTGAFQCTEVMKYPDNTDQYGGYDPNSQEGQRYFWDNLAR